MSRSSGPSDDVHTRTNERIIERAREIDEYPHALIVWKRREGRWPWGHGRFVARLGRVSGDERVAVIDSTP